MGGILQSCECKIDCCNKNKNILENNNNEDSDEYEDEDEEYDENEKFIGIVKKQTKKHFSLPSDVINMKVRANTIIEHNVDPWSIYEELEEIGFGAYGVVKKVCLKTNRDTIRAIKIIPKDMLNQGFDDEKLSNCPMETSSFGFLNFKVILKFFLGLEIPKYEYM